MLYILELVHSKNRFLISARGLISISERTAIREHATATITALLAGRRVFKAGFDERNRLLQLVRGVHGIHVYATEFWTEYLLSDSELSNGPDVSSDLFALALRLAQELSTGCFYPLPKELIVQPADIDVRLQIFQQHRLLHEQMKASINSRSLQRLEIDFFKEQGRFSNTKVVLSESNHTKMTDKKQDPQAATGSAAVVDAISYMLQCYQTGVELLLNEESHPGVSAKELENCKMDDGTRKGRALLTTIVHLVKSQFRASAFTCRLRSCPRATLGFENDASRREHEVTHIGGYRCTTIGCQYPPFPSAKSLRTHMTNVHNPNPIPKSIRHVGQLNDLDRQLHTLPSSRENTTSPPPLQPDPWLGPYSLETAWRGSRLLGQDKEAETEEATEEV